MKITALVENKPGRDLRGVHGLSLYIEAHERKILFDLGPDNTIFDNSAKLGIDLTAIDTVIISHGHHDHGGALRRFLEINKTAKIYVQEKAFDKHYARVLLLNIDVGIDAALKNHPQIVLANGDFVIDEALRLITVSDTSKCRSEANDMLFDDRGRDTFSHEQSLIISDDTTVLITGCGHAGIVNILEKTAEFKPQICVGGYHLYNPSTKKTVAPQLLDEIAAELTKFSIRFYTCHCTGEKAFRYLSERVPDMTYFACGDTLEV